MDNSISHDPFQPDELPKGDPRAPVVERPPAKAPAVQKRRAKAPVVETSSAKPS